jgi:4-amino-4-deoxy-L-arabinose transferase-like glycosyltransferase
VLLVAVHTFGGDWYRNGVLLNVVVAAGTLIVLHRLLTSVFTRRLAVWVVILISLNRHFFLPAHKASTDLLFLLWCYLAWHLLLARRFSWLRLAGSSLLCGLAFLTRYNGLILPVVAIGVFMINPGGWTRRRQVTAGLVFLVIFLVVISPWYAVNQAETGRLLATRNLQNIFVEQFYGGEHAARMPATGLSTLREIIRHDPLHFGRQYLTNLIDHLKRDGQDLLGEATAILVGLGLLQLLFRRLDRRQATFFVLPVCYFLAMCTVYYLPRFFLPLLPAYYVLGLGFLLGTHSGDGWWRWSDRYPVVRLGITGLVLAGIIGLQLERVVAAERDYYDQRPLFVPAAAEFLQAHHDGSDVPVVMARKPHIAYYAGMRYLPYPQSFAGGSELLTFARRQQVQYIVYSTVERYFYPDRSFLKRLDVVDGVERIYRGRQIAIYELE